MMNDNDIKRIAAESGWDAQRIFDTEQWYIDFRRTTPSGVPFCFGVEIDRDIESSIVDEILSFVDAINPAVCAEQWMISSGAVSPTRYRQAVADMEHIRSEAWLLACRYAKAANLTYPSRLTSRQWLN